MPGGFVGNRQQSVGSGNYHRSSGSGRIRNALSAARENMGGLSHPVEWWKDRSRGQKALMIGALTVWSLGSYDKFNDWINAPQIIPVTPTQTVANIFTLPDKFLDDESHESTAATVPSTSTTTPGNTTAITVPVTLSGSETTASQNTLAPLPTQPNVTSPPAVVTAAPNTSPVETVAEFPTTYSAAAGSVACSGPVMRVTITADGGFPLRQLQNATGEPWTASAVEGENPLDAALYNEVLNNSGHNPATPPALPYDVFVRTGCTGLEK